MISRNVRAIAVLISSESGHSVELFGLHIYRLEDGRYAVRADGEEKMFKSAVKAAKYFERIREKRKVGFDFDFERETNV
jgi:hypothetical protein